MGEEDPCFDKSPAPPPQVLASILKTDAARETLTEMSKDDRRDVAKLFKASMVHLHNQSQVDMVVRGDAPMSGADNTWFWIVTSIEHAPFALWVGGNAVGVLKTKHNGYADLRVSWASAAEFVTWTYHYDGRSYRLFYEKHVGTSKYGRSAHTRE